MSTASALDAHTVRTREIADPGDLDAVLPIGPTVSWIRDGDGLVGWGERARFEWTGASAEPAVTWWQDFCAELRVTDELGVTGTGPLAFASLAFDHRTCSSVLIVPQVLLGRHEGRAWITTYDDAAALPRVDPVRGPGAVRFEAAALTPEQWAAAVADAVTRIRAGEVQKVVLSRDVLAHTEVPVDPRYLIGRLMRRYPSCWTYCVDGLVGATPELLIRRRGRVVDSRVLAGTMPPGLPDDGGLMQSAKNRSEHAFSVRSVAEILAGFCDELDVPEAPSLLRLPNLVHLATDIRGTVSNGTQALSLAAALHPTAAVCGTPTDVAFDLIPLLEQMDRRRYYGPIGWLDAVGNGEFGIALRGAEVDGTTVRMIAGGGIVADSEPERELAEADTKFRVMREALDG